MNLEQQKKQARELLRAIRRGDAEALTRLRARHLRWADVDDAEARKSIALHDAQFVLAREQGFSSWPKLKAYAEPASGNRHTRIFVADVKWIADRVQGLIRTRLSAGPAALEQIREWHPRFADATDEEIRQAAFSEEDARLVYAREHGFDSWADLESRVEAVKSGRAEEPFKAAFDAIEKGDLPALRGLLLAHPGLTKERGTNGNTLLNLAGSIAARKKPLADLATTIALLDAAADVNDANDRGWTPLHQAGYANQPEMAELYIARGADLTAEAHGAGGTPLIAALFWGHREAADVLARHSTAPNNMRVAAGLGRLDLMDACFSGDGLLTDEACAARGFYRPHSGFPDWSPSTDSQEVLDEALVWAAKSDRVEMMDRLLQAGARVGADPYRGTPLIWACFNNRVNAAAWLMDHGADVNQKATFGGLTHGQGITALHLAAQCGHLEMVKVLVGRGADLSMKEDLYGATAVGAAEYFGQSAVLEHLKAVGG